MVCAWHKLSAPCARRAAGSDPASPLLLQPLLLQPLLLPACGQAWELLEQKRQVEVPRLWQQQTERARKELRRERA